MAEVNVDDVEYSVDEEIEALDAYLISRGMEIGDTLLVLKTIEHILIMRSIEDHVNYENSQIKSKTVSQHDSAGVL